MPDCKKCGEHFPNIMEIDGKFRQLCKRKYCLDCSPFKSRNTKRLHLPHTESVTGDQIKCLSCGRLYTYDKKKGHGKTKCNSCFARQRAQKVKSRCIDYKGGQCKLCGYSKCPGALNFHHLDPSTKAFAVGGNCNRSWDTLKKELDKCVMVCSNCHNEIHAGIVTLGD